MLVTLEAFFADNPRLKIYLLIINLKINKNKTVLKKQEELYKWEE
jgi:hypothetical protein